MPAVKSAQEIAKKWAKVTPQRSGDYVEGVTNPKKDWASETKAAEERYEQGIAASIAAKRYGAGVEKAGTSTWKKKTLAKSARWAQGVTIGRDAYQKGMAPVIEDIKATTLPPRYAKGDPRNWERAKAMGVALHEGALKRKSGS